MTQPLHTRLDHLKRMTDPRGLLRAANGDFPDRFAGYSAIDNADALRFCALASDWDCFGGHQELAAIRSLAKTYFDCLSRGRTPSGRVRHLCDTKGRWADEQDDSMVQARLARALATVIGSELPIDLRMEATGWWRELLPTSDTLRSPLAAGHWLLAIGQLKAADPGRDLCRAESLTRYLMDECFYPHRSIGWEWFCEQWTPGGAVMAAGLWSAYAMLQDGFILDVATRSTGFVCELVFEGPQFRPIGNQSTFSRGQNKPSFNQSPEDVLSVIEMLQQSHQATGNQEHGHLARQALRWFVGENVHGFSLVTESGSVHNGLTSTGLDPNQGGSATVHYLLSHCVLNSRGVHQALRFEYVDEPA